VGSNLAAVQAVLFLGLSIVLCIGVDDLGASTSGIDKRLIRFSVGMKRKGVMLDQRAWGAMPCYG